MEVPHLKTSTIDEKIEEVIRKLVFFQRRAFKLNPHSAKKKRRVVCGLKECFKYADLGKLKGMVVASDIDDEVLSSHEFIMMMRIVKNADVPIIRTVYRPNQLGSMTACFAVKVACIGLISVEGCHESFQLILNLNSERERSSVMELYADKKLLLHACKYGFVLPNDVYDQKIIDPQTGMDPLIIASKYGHLNLVETFISKGFDKSTVDFSLNTALHYDCQNGD